MQFCGVERGLWERGLEAYFQSTQWNSVQDYLGRERGHLNPEQMHRLSAFESIRDRLAHELKKKIKPLNNQYDPLRAVALSVGKDAAQEAYNLALAAGMKPENPRLTMLRFNLAL
jgi:hypothetical protein